MSKYVVYGYLTISAFAEVEAENEEDAREKAQGLDAPGLCHHCSDAGAGESGTWTLNGFADPSGDAVQDVELLT